MDPAATKVVVVGDLHGQLRDFLTILRMEGFPNERKVFIWNGDFVDRGNHSTQVLLLLYAMKLAWPTFVFLNRGNHESPLLNRRYNFLQQCKALYTEELYQVRDFP
jgi:hypothetical protein